MHGFGAAGAFANKHDRIPDYLGEKLGVPMAVRNSQAERAVLMEEAKNAQQQAAIAQAMMMQQQAGQAPMAPMTPPEGAMA
jgi:hypothetical protein